MEEQVKEKAQQESAKWTQNLSQLTEKSQLFFNKILEKQIPSSSLFQMIHFNQLYQKFIQQVLVKPEKLVDFQTLYWQELFFLWQRFMMSNASTPAAAEANVTEKSFQESLSPNNPIFQFIKDFYLLHTRHFQSLLKMADGLDNKSQNQLQFYMKQINEAFSPSNFAATNPQVWQATLETQGENLLKGLDNAIRDLNKDDEYFQIKMTETSTFEVGKNVAVTPGKVVYQNEVMQLIQYEPQTKKVFELPLLMIPPWINKYYILDLNPSLSLVNWMVQQGYTVFMISWINPDKNQAQNDFTDYLLKGPLEALSIIEQACGVRQINALGYCVGGTLLACAQAYLAYQQDTRIASASYLCTMLDFSEPGDLGTFIDETQLHWMEEEMQRKGYHDGREMANTFNMLRPKDLIWSYYVKNYLLGENPAPHDLLFWNSDSTHIPEKVHRFYLRNLYLDNRLKESDALRLNEVPIDLKRIKTPAFFIATEGDHITPWKSVYAGTKLFSSSVNFTLGGSGHIAGAINPPDRHKYSYFSNKVLSEDAASWKETATEEAGSWWPCWEKWLRKQSGEKVAARELANSSLPIIEDAPGSYVRVKVKPVQKEKVE